MCNPIVLVVELLS